MEDESKPVEVENSDRQIVSLLKKMVQLQQELNTYSLESLNEIRHVKREQEYIERLLEQIVKPVADFQLSQIIGGEMGAITGIKPGASNTFQATLLPAGSSLQSGPSFAVDDPLVTLAPSPDGDVTKIVATVPATDTATSFNMKVSGVNVDGTTPSHVFSIPILEPTPPPPVPVSDFDLTQLD